MNSIEHHSPVWSMPRVAAFLVSVSLLASCSSSAGSASPESSGTGNSLVDGSRSPTAVSSSASTPIPTPSPTYKPAPAAGPAENVPFPVMPAEAAVQSKEGLEAFARYWYELLNYVYKTGNSEPVRTVTSPNCVAANNFYDAVNDGYEDGSWMGGSEINTRIITSNYVLTVESRYQLEVEMFQEPLEYYESDGTARIAHPRVNPGRQLFEASYSPNGWRVENVASVQGSSP